MDQQEKNTCTGCTEIEQLAVDRRDFLRGALATTAALAAGGVPLWATPKAVAAPSAKSSSETAVKALYETLTADQKKEVCFGWEHEDEKRGQLRSFVSNNWHITKPTIDSNFFNKDQKALIREVYKGLFNPDWLAKIDQQLKDDTGGKAWGAEQNIAIFGAPGKEKFELVMTGRHLTARADGNSAGHVAFGGPIFHGHAAKGFNEEATHPGNVFWHQAKLANSVYQMFDGKQQKQALVKATPGEADVKFRGKKGEFPGLPVSEFSKDQRAGLEKVLVSLLEPYRKEDHDEALACLKAQGGLEACSLAFYEAGDIGGDKVWDNWRIEGPSFVWYFRGSPHVHIWIHVADDASVKLNSRG